jgi:hypothetical protein
VHDSEAGLLIIDMSDPANPKLVATYAAIGYENRTFVSGNYAYVSDYTAGLHVIDVSNPAVPQRIGGYVTPGFAVDVVVSGNYAYVVDGAAGLYVIDVRDPASPKEAGVYAPRNEHGELLFPQGVVVSGDYAYVNYSGAYNGLHIVNVSNPANPALVGLLDYEGSARIVSGVLTNHVYLTSGQVIDVSDPARPRWACGYSGHGIQNGVVSGQDIYVADGTLRVIDLSRPANPQRVGHHSATSASAQRGDVFVSDRHAYVADGTSGFQIIDISNPASPQRIGSYDTPGTTESVFVLRDLAYVADWNGGLQVIDIRACLHWILYQLVA